ncbi:GNAT family N-acetyltransferase [Candidatus Woesearchaeota archaeon]|nr:GNAT family N-acetyltransferase [Candidatus Woesearchaeota archaeon]
MHARKFRISDAAEVARMHRNTIRFVNSKDYPQKQIKIWADRTSAKRFRNSIDMFYRFVAVDNGKIVGYGDFKKEGELAGLYVHKEYQGKGAGYLLLKKLEESAKQKGIKKFYMYSTITAKDFYKMHGYRIVRKTKFSIKNQKLIVYYMEKKLR